MPKPNRNRSVLDAPAARSRDRLWLSLIVVGVLLRIAIALVSIGSNDTVTWLQWGIQVGRNGLFNTYAHFPQFNHPPFPAYWAALCAKLAGNDTSPPHDRIFAIVFKLAPILGDCLGIYLLYLIWLPRRGETFALFVAAMFSLSINAIVVSGYHGNTDSLMIALCLLCLYFLQGAPRPPRPLLAGLALAAAINVKLIPVFLIPPLLLQMRSWRAAFRFLAGLAAGVLPFIPLLLKVPAQFCRNALQYNSTIDRWGINFFFLYGEAGWDPAHPGERVIALYYGKTRYVILLLIALWGLLARIKPRWTVYEIAAVVFAVFLILAPGFGVQYTVLIGLPLFAARPRWAIVYAVLAGLFVTATYFVYLTDSFPFYSDWVTLLPYPVAALGLATWFLLIGLVLYTLIRPAKRP